MAEKEVVVKVKDLVKKFGDRAVLNGVDLEIYRGETFVIMGGSGCGKSTLFSIIGGLAESTTGEVLIKGEKIKGPHPAVGMVFQEESAFPWLTSLENVEFGLKMNGVSKGERREKEQPVSGGWIEKPVHAGHVIVAKRHPDDENAFEPHADIDED